MKNICYLILLLVGTVNAQNIVFNGTVFKNKLLQSNTSSAIAKDFNGINIQIDANSDNEISYAEAQAVYMLDVQNAAITNMTGIEYFINLTNLRCDQNIFATIDVSSLTNLANLNVSSNINLTRIFSKNGSNETIIFGTSTPNLVYICSDESQVSSLLDSNGSSLPNYVVNSYCTVSPGGNYNKITGQILYDDDGNSSTTNTPNPYVKLICNINGNTLQTVSKASGDFSLYTTETGNYNLTPNIENPSWFTFSTVSSMFANSINNINTNNFLLVPNGIHHDVEISIRPIAPPIGNLISTVTYDLVFRNKGTQPHSGQVIFNYNQLTLGYLTSSLPVTLGLGSLTHNFINLLPFETRYSKITMSTLSLLPVGSFVPMNITIDTAGENAATQNDNSYNYNQKVASNNNSNKVECLEGDSLSESEIGKYLHYAINFENTGNQVAKNITIKTELDEAKYDINSLQILRTTHPLDLEIINNKVYYKFRNADVGGPGGQGGILLKMKTNNSLSSGSTVIYGAEIFFDYEIADFPKSITTNDATTTFGTLNVSINQHDDSIIVYPNPTSSVVFVKSSANEMIRNVELYDVSGRLLQTIITNAEASSIDLSERAGGIYFLKITSDNGQKVHKIMKK